MLNDQSSRFLPAWIQEVPVAIYSCDADGLITSYNRAAAALWGREPIIGQDLWCGSWNIYESDGTPLELDLCPMAVTLKTGTAVKGREIMIERPDGTRRNILPFPIPVFDERGDLTGAVNTLLDITEITRDIRERRETDENRAILAAIVGTSDDTIISKTLQGIITSWNKAAERMFGYTAQEAVGRHISLLIPRERLGEEDRIISAIAKGDRVDHFETIRVAKDGHLVPISLSVSPLKDSSGTIIGASKIARDISERVLAEKQARQHYKDMEILNSIGKAISENFDTQTILQKVTDASTSLTSAAFGAFFYNTIGENGEEFMLYTLSGAPREAFEKFGMPRNTKVFNATFSGLGIVRSDDITKDPRYGHNPPHRGMPAGHLPVVSYLAIPVISKSGTVIGGLFFGHPDPGRFTEQHERLLEGLAAQAAIALDNAKLYNEVQMLNSKKDEFIGLASHELKTPVTSIKGYLQILQKAPDLKETTREFVTKALRQTVKLTGLISDLLDVSKIEAGKLPLSKAPFDLCSLLEEVAEMASHDSSIHEVNLITGMPYLEIVADRNRLEQVFINLVGNAIKYSPNGGRVDIQLTQDDQSAVISVKDSGIGIRQSDLAAIFSRFYRVEDTPHISGLGIGLYLAHEIISRHHGVIWVSSEPGNGSTFFVKIPLAGSS